MCILISLQNISVKLSIYTSFISFNVSFFELQSHLFLLSGVMFFPKMFKEYFCLFNSNSINSINSKNNNSNNILYEFHLWYNTVELVFPFQNNNNNNNTIIFIINSNSRNNNNNTHILSGSKSTALIGSTPNDVMQTSNMSQYFLAQSHLWICFGIL